MINIFSDFYDSRTLFSLYTNETSCSYSDIEQRLEKNTALLKQSLDNEQRKLLLRIIDDKDLFCDRAARCYYSKGFRRALLLLAECFFGGD